MISFAKKKTEVLWSVQALECSLSLSFLKCLSACAQILRQCHCNKVTTQNEKSQSIPCPSPPPPPPSPKKKNKKKKKIKKKQKKEKKIIKINFLFDLLV